MGMLHILDFWRWPFLQLSSHFFMAFTAIQTGDSGKYRKHFIAVKELKTKLVRLFIQMDSCRMRSVDSYYRMDMIIKYCVEYLFIF